MRRAWRAAFRRDLQARFDAHFPAGWTYLMDWSDGALRISGPDAGQDLREHLPHEHHEVAPALALEQLLAGASRYAVGRGWMPAARRPWRAHWHVVRGRGGELVPALLLCPEGHEIAGVGPAQARARCAACQREYEIE